MTLTPTVNETATPAANVTPPPPIVNETVTVTPTVNETATPIITETETVTPTETITQTETVNDTVTVTPPSTPAVNETVTPPVTPAGLMAFPGAPGLPSDSDRDGLYEDINGNGRPDFADVVLLFNSLEWVAANEPEGLFDANGNGRVDFADVTALFERL